MLIKADVNLPVKTVFTNENWKQSVTVHVVEYKGRSKLCVDIILATLYIPLCDQPICIFHRLIVLVFEMKESNITYKMTPNVLK